MLNGRIGDKISKQIETTTSSRCSAISTTASAILDCEEADRRTERPARNEDPVQQAKIFATPSTGFGSAVPMALASNHRSQAGRDRRRRSAYRQHEGLKIYDVSKYASLTYHNYGPTNAVMNLDVWNGLSPDQQKLIMDLSRAAQVKIPRRLSRSTISQGEVGAGAVRMTVWNQGR